MDEEDEAWDLDEESSQHKSSSNPLWRTSASLQKKQPKRVQQRKSLGIFSRNRNEPDQSASLLTSAASNSVPSYKEEDDEAEALPLHAAAFYGRFSVLSDLISRENLTVCDSGGNSVLHYCVEGGDRSLGCLSLLLAHRGINKNVQNEKGQTPLHAAAIRGHEESMLALLLSGCKRDITDADGNTAAHIAALLRYKACRDLLFAQGASRDIRNLDGLTPMEISEKLDADLQATWNVPRHCCQIS